MPVFLMGCLCDKNEKPNNISDGNCKQYSWDKRACNADPLQFMTEGLVDSEVWKLAGSIGGQQYVVQNCTNSLVYLLDHINTLTVDDCSGCKLIIGPVKGSVFLRDCKDCTCLVACGQFRMRDCHNVNVFLCCPTQPIIESSRRIHFGCYQLFYNQLEGQFASSGLSVFNNNWSNVHDFTPCHGDTNWCILPSTMSVTDYIQQPTHHDACSLDLTFMKETSIVPLTTEIYPDPSDDVETCLVVFFHNTQEEAMAKLFIRTLFQNRPSCWLVSCRQLTLEPRDAEVVFGTTAHHRAVQSGPIIGLVCAGSRVIYSCQKTVLKVSQTNEGVYVSNDPRTAPIQAETFTNIAAMLLSS